MSNEDTISFELDNKQIELSKQEFIRNLPKINKRTE
jgi:hypothetical protein